MSKKKRIFCVFVFLFVCVGIGIGIGIGGAVGDFVQQQKKKN